MLSVFVISLVQLVKIYNVSNQERGKIHYQKSHGNTGDVGPSQELELSIRISYHPKYCQHYLKYRACSYRKKGYRRYGRRHKSAYPSAGNSWGAGD
jgi:hypothetical protein